MITSPQSRRWFTESGVVLVLLTIQAALLAYSATTHSPTQLEPAFLASGISHWKFGRFELYRVNPPLVRMVAALPVMAAGCESDWHSFNDAPGARSEFSIGSDFIKANGPASIALFFYARFACIPFTLIGGYFAFRWANELYGRGAGIITLTLYTFEPNILAHGELITPDAAATSFGIMAGYTFWKWLKAPSWARAFIAGGAFGLAELAKMTWLILFALWPALWLTWRFLTPKNSDSSTTPTSKPIYPPVKQLILILIVPVYMVNLCYAFDGTGTPLKDYTFVSRSLSGRSIAGESGNRFRNTLLENLPVPLPKQYLLGFDSQKKDFEDYPQKSYLRGEWKEGGWWYYYAYGLLVKVPSGTWFLFASLLIWRFLSKTCTVPMRDEIILVIPAIFLLIFISSQTEFSIHLRYIFPALGLGQIFFGQGIFLLTSRGLLVKSTVVFLVVYSVASPFSVYPHQLAYFNDFVGGPLNGHKHLIGSSFDWGQDFLPILFLSQSSEDFALGSDEHSRPLYDVKDLVGGSRGGAESRGKGVLSVSSCVGGVPESSCHERLCYTLLLVDRDFF